MFLQVERLCQRKRRKPEHREREKECRDFRSSFKNVIQKTHLGYICLLDARKDAERVIYSELLAFVGGGFQRLLYGRRENNGRKFVSRDLSREKALRGSVAGCQECLQFVQLGLDGGYFG